MPKHLAKVQKKIAKKKGALASLHENSRDAKRLRRAGARSEKLSKLATAREKAYQPYQSYLLQNSTELANLQAQRRPGRPASTREDRLRHTTDAERKEYISGYWVPDMEDKDLLVKLKAWNGKWTSLNTLEFVRLREDGTKHASSFPPRGKS
ncbi:MAG: hypothetical protein Q9219_004275 [cf. Caloplaca sp. 3 TL-2023]